MILEGGVGVASDDKVTKKIGAWFGMESIQGMSLYLQVVGRSGEGRVLCVDNEMGQQRSPVGARVPLSEVERTGRWQTVPQRKEEGNSAQWLSLGDRGLL